jgi:hypothetical protein
MYNVLRFSGAPNRSPSKRYKTTNQKAEFNSAGKPSDAGQRSCPKHNLTNKHK